MKIKIPFLHLHVTCMGQSSRRDIAIEGVSLSDTSRYPGATEQASWNFINAVPLRVLWMSLSFSFSTSFLLNYSFSWIAFGFVFGISWFHSSACHNNDMIRCKLRVIWWSKSWNFWLRNRFVWFGLLYNVMVGGNIVVLVVVMSLIAWTFGKFC